VRATYNAQRGQGVDGGTVPGVSYRIEQGVALVTLDNPPVNALSVSVRAQLAASLERAQADAAAHAIVLAGAHGSFCAGADIAEVASGAALSAPLAQDIQAQIEASAKPVVSAIEGMALGGGLELALCCHFRVGAETCQVGLPEVKLGLVPGGGGTVRFTRLAGAQAALESLTSGASLSAARALELGLIDEIAPAALPAALTLATRAAGSGAALPLARTREERVRGVPAQLFEEFRRRIGPKARGQLAPFRIIDCVEAATTLTAEEALARERAAFLECRASPQHQALVHAFFAERAARRIPGIPGDLPTRPIRRAAVIGAGTMGGGIAMCFANAGLPVVLLEASAEQLERGLSLIGRNYEHSVQRGSMSAARAAQARALIRGAREYAELGSADIIVEAVFEKLEVKQEVFQRLDQVAAPQAILATNTSTLDIDRIAAATARPHAVVGTHFFSPAHVMRLLENVRGRATAPDVIATVMALGRTLGKVPVLAGNCDGFIGNRMLGFYGLEAEFLLEEGATPEQIDRVIEGFGFAMGPLAVRDLAGNDVGWAIRKARRLPADERFSPILERLVGAGRLGQKSGRGFYRYEGRARHPDPEVLALIESVSGELGIARRSIPDQEILERLLHPLVNEGTRILEEGIALRAGDIDVVYINGYGFPAWRGGPMFWAREQGLTEVVRTTERLAATHGARWGPTPLLRRLAASGGGWES
jgi:3-hydroxyacyl-CoA dehydrogenase